MIGDTEDVDYAALELDHEQHIELAETDRVHDEEVGSQDAARLGGEELLPGSTAVEWSETVTSKYSADRACRDADPKSRGARPECGQFPSASSPGRDG